jgi:hypothetical protein
MEGSAGAFEQGGRAGAEPLDGHSEASQVVAAAIARQSDRSFRIQGLSAKKERLGSARSPRHPPPPNQKNLSRGNKLSSVECIDGSGFLFVAVLPNFRSRRDCSGLCFSSHTL